jgi:nucleotide-binding universal stress UspA family protein
LITLRDGSRVEIRPVEPYDRDAIAHGFERLSPESRYRRFFGPMPELPERYLDFLTRVDHHDHEALVAVDPSTGDGVGVARYVRTGDDVAEAAIAVIDDWHGRGVGSRLLDALADRAREEGVTRFEAPVLAGNRGAIAVLERLGSTTKRSQGNEILLDIELPSAPGAGTRWRSMLKAVASGTVEPARTVIDLLWPRRPGEPGDEHRNVIVVGTDGSDHAAQAIETAASVAAGWGAAVEVVGAHRFLPPEQAGVTQAVRDACETLRARGLHVHEHVRRGDAALILTDVAAERNARLIVVGAGQRGSAAPFIGSVADFVAQRAPCDVLIVRKPDARSS